MKILMISNIYPPHVVGGYEIACSDMAEGLCARGHEVRVLTSRSSGGAPENNGVSRALAFVPYGKAPSRPLEILALSRREKKQLKQEVKKSGPDILYFWNGAQIAGVLPSAALASGVPAVFYFSSTWWLEKDEWDAWIKFWKNKTGAGRLARPAAERLLPLKKDRSRLGHAHFSSRDLMLAYREAGVEIQDGEIVPHGVDTSSFSPDKNSLPEKPFRLLYSGQIVEHKGVHTAVEALSLLFKKGRRDFELTILGPEVVPEYAQRLKEKIRQAGLEAAVRFAGMVSRAALPGFYRRHHALVFPSVYREPFGISALEAMACGLCVMGTATGGSAEFLKNNQTGLTFPPGDAAALAACLERVQAGPSLRLSLGSAARREACLNFDIKNVVLKAEASLRRILEEAKS